MASVENITLMEQQTVEEIPKWKLAREGIQLIINNKPDEADILFKKYPDSIHMFAGYSFALFMDALMTFEEEKLNLAIQTLKEVERRCAVDTGWLKSMRKVFGTTSDFSLAENLESRIILADSQVCISILTFLQQDISGYFKGGWVLRKAWKIYQHTYNEIRTIYREVHGEFPDYTRYRSNSQQNIDEDEDGSATSDGSCEWEFPDDPNSSSTLPPNGYNKNVQYSSKMSHSYTTNFDEHHNINNAYTSFPNSNLKHSLKSCSCSSNNNSCAGNNDVKDRNCDLSFNICNSTDKRSLRSVNGGERNVSNTNYRGHFSKMNGVLKKSSSVNSALFKQSDTKQPNGFFSQLSPFNSNLSLTYLTSSFNIFSVDKQMPDIDKETITRLMGAVSFGFGLFHLGISLLPPSLLKITQFLGFGGNRNVGISNLMYAKEGAGMRAPLATLALLWYHTIVRPFYALDGSNVQAGVKAAKLLIAESDQEYADSGLFLFFKGRVHRLNSDIPAALKAFQASVDNSNQREIKILSLHEVGWCYLIQLDYPSAEHTFQILKLSSRWSRSFYSYLATICAGSCHNLKDFSNLKEMRGLFENAAKGTQLELFLIRRLKCCPSKEEEMAATDEKFWKLFVYELLYLWNTLPSCATKDLKTIIEDCLSTTNEPMLGMSKLIQGSCYCDIKEFDNGIASYRKCLEVRSGKALNADDAHVSAFAQYELGTILIKNPETKEEGKTLLNQMLHYKDYDFEQRLTVRIHAILKTL